MTKEAARLSADGSVFTILRTDDIVGFVLHIGDIILEVGRRAVNTAADFRKMVEEPRAQSKRAVLLRITGDGTTTFVGPPIG